MQKPDRKKRQSFNLSAAWMHAEYGGTEGLHAAAAPVHLHLHGPGHPALRGQPLLHPRKHRQLAQGLRQLL